MTCVPLPYLRGDLITTTPMLLRNLADATLGHKMALLSMLTCSHFSSNLTTLLMLTAAYFMLVPFSHVTTNKLRANQPLSQCLSCPPPPFFSVMPRNLVARGFTVHFARYVFSRHISLRYIHTYIHASAGPPPPPPPKKNPRAHLDS